ncbi:MAG: monophosphatase [Candidatus Binatota bacterium]|nr:monophosphatase [Candidatus Binatota bacterium]
MKELEVAISAARAAGAAIRSLYGSGVEVIEKGDRTESPLTAADTRSNEIIRAAVGAAFPADGWLSEETEDSRERLELRRVWIVDPLDGTREFVREIPELAVAIALVEDGAPIVGVTYNPIRDEIFAAARGTGATRNGEPIRVSDRTSLADAVLLASRSEDARGEWDRFKGRFRVELTGSVAYKLALVGAGRADATFTLTPKSEWDVASSVCIIEAAGGRVTDLEGNPLRFNRENTRLAALVASNGKLHSQLLAIVR